MCILINLKNYEHYVIPNGLHSYNVFHFHDLITTFHAIIIRLLLPTLKINHLTRVNSCSIFIKCFQIIWVGPESNLSPNPLSIKKYCIYAQSILTGLDWPLWALTEDHGQTSHLQLCATPSVSFGTVRRPVPRNSSQISRGVPGALASDSGIEH